MDVKYISADWEKMRAGLSDLLGHGWGKALFTHLKDVNEVLEDAERDIAKYDVDGAISFHHTSQKSLYNSLADDFSVLHRFTGKVGDIVDRTIDEPFYKDMDAFVQSVRDLSISNYTTGNRIGATETVQYGYGAGTTKMEVPKTEVGIDDLLSGGNFYADQMKQQFEEWKVANPGEEISEEEYRTAAVNSRAFEYESIRDKQENKEFWAGIAALVVIVGVSLICPPAGIALGAAYGVMELSSAVSGKDWVSGREMSTSERWTRGLLAPLDIIPAAGAVSKFAKGAELARLGDHVGQLGIRAGSSIRAGAHQVQHLANSAANYATTRLRNAANALNDAKNVAINKVARDLVDVGKAVDTSVTWMRNNLNPGRLAATPDGTVFRIKETAENTHKVENNLKDFLSRFEGINLKAEGKGNSVSHYLDDIIVNGKVDAAKLNKLKNAIQNNTFSVDELSEIRKVISDLGITREYDEALLRIDFGKYLRGLIGNPPSAMINPHAHHILFKKGLGEAQQRLVLEGQELLRRYGIDPIIGKENLVWAPNAVIGQHSLEALKNVVNQLKLVEAEGGDLEDIVEVLEELGNLASRR